MVTTDIFSRGLCVEGVRLVINYDMPTDPLVYLHRASKCSRNGYSGTCISMAEYN